MLVWNLSYLLNQPDGGIYSGCSISGISPYKQYDYNLCWSVCIQHTQAYTYCSLPLLLYKEYIE